MGVAIGQTNNEWDERMLQQTDCTKYKGSRNLERLMFFKSLHPALIPTSDSLGTGRPWSLKTRLKRI